MNEYKIHQRWFARLKQKVSSKRRELEETWTRGKENVAFAANAPYHDLLRTVSPERAQRKRKSQGADGVESPDSLRNSEDLVKVHIPHHEVASHTNMADAPRGGATSKPPQPSAPEIQNGYLMGPQGKPPVSNSVEEPVENGISFLSYSDQATERVVPQPRGKEFAANKKKRRLSKEEGEALSVGKAEGSSRRDESAQNGIDGNEGLPETLRGNASRGDPQPVKSRDRMEIDEQASSVTLGQWQPSAVPSSPATEDIEVTHSTDDATLAIGQEPVYSNLQTPVRDMYFSMKDMFFETIQEPEMQPQLPQAKETMGQASAQEQINPQEVGSTERVDLPPLIDVMLRGDPDQAEESEDMGTARIEMDIEVPCLPSEIQNQSAPDNDVANSMWQSSGDRESSHSRDTLNGGPPHVDPSKAQDGSLSPPCISEAVAPPAVQPLYPLADIVRPEEKGKASPSPPTVEAEPVAEGLKPASPRKQPASGTLAE
eukprot:g34394.t1